MHAFVMYLFILLLVLFILNLRSCNSKPPKTDLTQYTKVIFLGPKQAGKSAIIAGLTGGKATQLTSEGVPYYLDNVDANTLLVDTPGLNPTMPVPMSNLSGNCKFIIVVAENSTIEELQSVKNSIISLRQTYPNLPYGLIVNKSSGNAEYASVVIDVLRDMVPEMTMFIELNKVDSIPQIRNLVRRLSHVNL